MTIGAENYDRGKVVGLAPRANAFETTLKGKADRSYVGRQLQFVSGGLVRFSANIADYEERSGLIVIDRSLPTAPEPGDDFVIYRDGP